MAGAKREKTKYAGVYFRLQKKIASEELERVYYIFYRHGGRDTRQIEERVGRESEGITAAKANQIRALRMVGAEPSNKERRKAAEDAKKEAEGRPTIARLWTAYDEGHPLRKVRKNDKSIYRNHLEKSFADKTPAEIITLDIDSLRLKALKKYKPQTVKHILSLLQRIIRYGVSKGLCSQPDPSRLHFAFPKVDNQKTENLTIKQLQDLMAALDEEADQNGANIIRLALATGMRRSALFSLLWEDIDFERGFIRLRGESAKNEKTQSIPLSPLARDILEKTTRSESPYVFPGKHGQKRTDFKYMPARVRDKAGLPKSFRPLHGLRHTFASWLASTGDVDMYTLQKLMTHSSAAMTQRYAHLHDDALQRAATIAGNMFDIEKKK